MTNIPPSQVYIIDVKHAEGETDTKPTVERESCRLNNVLSFTCLSFTCGLFLMFFFMIYIYANWSAGIYDYEVPDDASGEQQREAGMIAYFVVPILCPIVGFFLLLGLGYILDMLLDNDYCPKKLKWAEEHVKNCMYYGFCCCCWKACDDC